MMGQEQQQQGPRAQQARLHAPPLQPRMAEGEGGIADMPVGEGQPEDGAIEDEAW